MDNSSASACFTPHCLLCDAIGMVGKGICQGCFDDLPWSQHACSGCALPLANLTLNDHLCGKCQKSHPPFDHAFAPLKYEREIAPLISGFKFRNKLEYGKLLSQILADFLKQHIDHWPELLIPVPLHKNRLRERGYNQSLEIARLLGKQFSIPIDIQSLQRHRDTKHQSELNYTDRRKNIKSAFTLTKPLNIKRVALIDDVITTGETVAEISQLLKRGGVQQVDVWALARTP